MPSPQRACAFCLSGPVLALRRTTPFIPLNALGRPRTLPLTPEERLPKRCSNRHLRKRPRSPRVVAVFNDNGNGKDSGESPFRLQTAEFLLSAARFLRSPPGQVMLWAGLVWLVITGRIGFIFDSFLVLFAFVTIVPVLAVLGFRWWLSRQLVQGTCPSCGSVVTGLKGQSFPCTVCGNTVQGETTGNFSVKDPTSATIDIDAKEIDDW